MSIQAEAVVKTVRGAGMAGRCEPAAKADFAAHAASLEMKYAVLETKFTELRVDVSATINGVIVSQAVVYAALFSALKLC